MATTGGHIETLNSTGKCIECFSETINLIELKLYIHSGKADDRNCNYGHPKMADMQLGKNLFCRLNCFYNVFQMTHALVR